MNDAEVDSHTLPSFLRLRVAESPAAIAFWQEADHTGWDPITWKEFELRVARLRDALHAAGLRKGERLALIAPVSLEWELVHHAALAMGAVVVGIDAHDLPTRIAILAEQADVAGFVTSDARTLASVLPQRLARVRFVLDLSSGGKLISRNVYLFDVTRNLDLPTPAIKSELTGSGGKYSLKLDAPKPVDTGAAAKKKTV